MPISRGGYPSLPTVIIFVLQIKNKWASANIFEVGYNVLALSHTLSGKFPVDIVRLLQAFIQSCRTKLFRHVQFQRPYPLLYLLQFKSFGALPWSSRTALRTIVSRTSRLRLQDMIFSPYGPPMKRHFSTRVEVWNATLSPSTSRYATLFTSSTRCSHKQLCVEFVLSFATDQE